MTTSPPTLAPLSVLLRERTREVHGRAEREPFVAALVEGRVPLRGYAALAAQHRAIYTALEACGARLCTDAVAGPVQHDDLLRAQRLDHDLAAMLGDEDPDGLVVAATRRYVDRLAGLDAQGFVAHHYVRYLGDLSGGQIVRRAVERAYGPGTPVDFYRFDGLGPVKPFRDAYRNALDALPLDEAGRAVVVDEAMVAFDLNRAVFADLAPAYC